MKTWDDLKEELKSKYPYLKEDVEEMEEVGFDDCVYSEGITIVEWAGIIEEIIPKGTYVVNIAKDLTKGNDYRKITITKTTKEGYLN